MYDENIEKMTEVSDENKIRELINTIYKADVQAIRNLSDIARKLQGQDGKDITLPGNFRIEGNLNVGGSTAITGDTTIDGATTLKKELTANESINLKKDLKMIGGQSIRSTGRLHIVPEEILYLLPKKGTLITKDWGASGSINMTSDLIVGGNSTVSGNSTVTGNSIIGGKRMYNSTRYIYIGNNYSSNWDKYWAIQEVEVFVNNVNVALGKPVKIIVGSSYKFKEGYTKPEWITNGKKNTDDYGTYYHGGGDKKQSMLQIDLGKSYLVDKISIHGRYLTKYTFRQKGTHVALHDSNGNRQKLYKIDETHGYNWSSVGFGIS